MISNVPTGRMVKVIRTTGRSSDYLGPCEICSENMSESYAARYGRERLKENGVVYIDKSGVAHTGIKNVYWQWLMLSLIPWHSISAAENQKSNFPLPDCTSLLARFRYFL
jgi:hypothetical protein